jgi:hypothetical protein
VTVVTRGRRRLRTDLRAYRVLLGSRLRSQTAYRTGFALDVVGQLGLALLEFSEIYVLFHNIDVLGGLGLGAALLVFALANVSWSLADMAVGHMDRLPVFIRAGTLDAMLVRPLPVLAQLLTSDLSLRRLSRSLSPCRWRSRTGRRRRWCWSSWPRWPGRRSSRRSSSPRPARSSGSWTARS